MTLDDIADELPSTTKLLGRELLERLASETALVLQVPPRDDLALGMRCRPALAAANQLSTSSSPTQQCLSSSRTSSSLPRSRSLQVVAKERGDPIEGDLVGAI